MKEKKSLFAGEPKFEKQSILKWMYVENISIMWVHFSERVAWHPLDDFRTRMHRWDGWNLMWNL